MAKKEPREKRVGEIIEAAIGVFLEKGYEATSMDAIAKASGISKGGIYHHFASKDEVLLAANSALGEPIIKLAEAAVMNTDPVAGLRDYILAYLAYWAENRQALQIYYLTMVKALSKPDFTEFYGAYVMEMQAFYQSLYQGAAEKGRMKPGDYSLQAQVLMNAVDGYTLYVGMLPGLDAEEAAKAIDASMIKPYLL